MLRNDGKVGNSVIRPLIIRNTLKRAPTYTSTHQSFNRRNILRAYNFLHVLACLVTMLRISLFQYKRQQKNDPQNGLRYGEWWKWVLVARARAHHLFSWRTQRTGTFAYYSGDVVVVRGETEVGTRNVLAPEACYTRHRECSDRSRVVVVREGFHSRHDFNSLVPSVANLFLAQTL